MRSVFGPEDPAATTQAGADKTNTPTSSPPKDRDEAPHERKMNIFGAQKTQKKFEAPQKPLCFGCKR